MLNDGLARHNAAGAQMAGAGLLGQHGLPVISAKLPQCGCMAAFPKIGIAFARPLCCRNRKDGYPPRSGISPVPEPPGFVRIARLSARTRQVDRAGKTAMQ